MLFSYLDKILMLYNFIDDICIIDSEGIIVYTESFREGAYSIDYNKVRGKHIFDVYLTSDKESSNMYQVLMTKEPILNYYTSWTTYNGDVHEGYVDTLPIFDGDAFLGVIEIAKFADHGSDNNIINLENNDKEKKIRGKYSIDDIITKSESMNKLKNRVFKISKTSSTVMVYGETGTGKEMIAQAIHAMSDRKNLPFISQNCAAIPGNLLESILFGTVKGAYTGAENRKGLFELASGGTLFLDEINSMDLNAQSKLLKAIEGQQTRRVGGESYIDTNVRIICALNERPLEAMANSNLREDLFYRLSAVMIEIPPLRERREDIKLLIEYYVKEFKKDFKSNIKGFSKESEKILMNYQWPGNVRELKNVVEGAFNLCDNEYISVEDLPSYITIGVDGKGNLDSKLADYEKRLIEEVLSESDSKVEAADKLNITKQSLNYKIKKYNL